MVTYTSLSAAQLFTYLTASGQVRNYLSKVQQFYVESLSYHQNKLIEIPSYPSSTDDFYNTVSLPASSIYCVVRNPYQRFIARWVRNTNARTKNNLTPFTFAEYITDYNNNHFVHPLNAQGLFETKDVNKIDFGPIASQITAAGLDTTKIKILKFESLVDDIKTIPYVDLSVTEHEQISTYNELIVNGAAKLDEYPTWKTLYDQSKADIIYNAFAGDFTAFGYAQDSWK
jgi:hypothetical protein